MYTTQKLCITWFGETEQLFKEQSSQIKNTIHLLGNHITECKGQCRT